MTNSETDTLYMTKAIVLAEKGMKKGEGGPFGAIIVKNNKIIGQGWNQVLKTNDPTAHAEIVAIRNACTNLDTYWLEGCTLYVNCEPCPMCMSAIYWAHIEKICFGATRKDAATIGFDDEHIYNEICKEPNKRKLKIITKLRQEALHVMHQWPQLTTRQDY